VQELHPQVPFQPAEPGRRRLLGDAVPAAGGADAAGPSDIDQQRQRRQIR
jgi:hypothetical protein